MRGRNLAVIVAALRSGCGATLLARVFADYFILSRENPLIFDTDRLDRTLSRYFPHITTVIDLDRIQGQMTLFDTLATPLPEKRVVDVTRRSFRKFFNLMHDIDYLGEARLREVEPVIFYIVARDRESYDHGRALRDRFDCPFVVVDNAFLGDPHDEARRSGAYAALASHPLHMRMPPLDPLMADMIADECLSLSAFMRQEPHNLSLAYLSLETRSSIRAWIMKMFKEIHRITQALDRRTLTIEDARPPSAAAQG
jgi:hypothetical protein